MRHLRLVHHQACTGGTIISRCLAALPKVALLSEISPAGRPARGFAPLSVLAQLLSGHPTLRPPLEQMAALLGADLQTAHDLAAAAGMQLVVRDHSHSDWMWGASPRQPSFALVRPMFERSTSILTVRHPTASYNSLARNGWHQDLAGYQDYCCRYLEFVESLGALPTFRYEAFTQAPATELARMAEALALPFEAEALQRWRQQDLTGNSGRAAKAVGIRPLPFTGWNPELERSLSGLAEHRALCAALGYPESLATYAEAQNRAALLHTLEDAELIAALAQLRNWRLATEGQAAPPPARLANRQGGAPRKAGRPSPP